MTDSQSPTNVLLLVKAIWEESLELPDVGPDDIFFQCGGGSLQAMQMLTRVREELGVEVPLACLFDARTLRAFAANVEEAIRDATCEEHPT